MTQTIHRDRFTWLAFLIFAFFAYLPNIPGIRLVYGAVGILLIGNFLIVLVTGSKVSGSQPA